MNWRENYSMANKIRIINNVKNKDIDVKITEKKEIEVCVSFYQALF